MVARIRVLFLSSVLIGGFLAGFIFAGFLPESVLSHWSDFEVSQGRFQEKIYPPRPDFGPDGLKDLTEDQKRRLFSGEVVMVSSHEGEPEGRTIVSAALILKVPVEKAWSALSATERQIEYLDEIEKLKTIEQAADHNRVEFLVRIMGQKVRYTVVHRFVPQEYYFWWELDHSACNDLRELYGFWKLYPAGEETVARYGSYVRPAFPVPGFVRDWLYKRNVQTSLKKVKKFVERAAG